MKRSNKPLAIAAVCLLISPAAFAVPVQTTGHTDIRFLYDAATDTADLAYYLDEGSIVDGQEISEGNPMGGTPLEVAGQTKIVFRPTELITFVANPPLIIPEEYEMYYAFTGAQGGDPLWNIPQSQDIAKPWTGFSTESVASTDFSNISYQLTAFSGPGHMSVLYWGVFGDPNPEMLTNDGLSSDDAIDVPAHAHAHYEWFFTTPGTYTFELTAIGTFVGGGTISAADTFTFQVAVPEPTSAGLMLTALCSVVVGRNRCPRD